MNAQIVIPRGRLASFCSERGIRRLSIFGSALRDDFGPESDIDVLVDFEPEYIPGLITLARIELGLAELFGRDVDLVTQAEVENSRNYIRRKSIIESATLVYAA